MAGGGGSGFEAFLPLILIFGVFYVLLIRPQQKKMKEHKAKIDAVKKGDQVVTGGGLVGKVYVGWQIGHWTPFIHPRSAARRPRIGSRRRSRAGTR